VLGWRGLDGITRSRTILTRQLEQSRGMQLAFAQMQSDLEHLADATLLNQSKNLATDSNRLTLVRTVFADNEATRVQVVSYRLVDGVLSRRESIATRDLGQLDGMWQSALSDTDPSPQVVLQTGIDSMAVRLWQGQGWSSASVDTSVTAPGSVPVQIPLPIPAAAQQQLSANVPTGMEVTLRLRGEAAGLVKIFLLGAV
jgi:general secretion pathway protein J